MSKKNVTLEEGKLKGIKLHSLWLRERLIGDDFIDQNNLQRQFEMMPLSDMCYEPGEFVILSIKISPSTIKLAN